MSEAVDFHQIGDDKFSAICAAAAEAAETIEAARAVPSALARQMARADMFSLYVPQDIGGPQHDPISANARLFHLARFDAASAWVSMIGSTASIGAAYVARDKAADLFAGEENIACGIFAPNGTAQIDGDDYIVSGRWAWASGSANADIIGLGCRIISDGVPDTVSDDEKSQKTPEMRLVLLPVAALIKHDNWHTMGLCGTSSGDVEAVNIRVPQAHSFSITADTPWPKSALYKMPYFGLLASGIGAVALGNARAALDDFLSFANAKTPAGTQKPLARRATVQAALAEAEAEWRAANAFYWTTLESVWDAALSAHESAAETEISQTHRADLRLAATHAVRRAVTVVRAVHDMAGGTSVYKTSPIQRRLRDSETITQHMMTNAASYELVGRVQLGGYSTDMML